MPQVFYKDGSAVPDAKVAEAVASGQAFAKSARVSVKDASGTVGTIDASELGHPGYQLLSDDEIDQERIHKERGTVGQQAITAAEGAARGASFGLSDVALTHTLGDKYRKGADERREENSSLATASEIGGAIVPGLLTGGESAVAEGALAAEEGSTLARGARAAAKAVSAPVRAVSKLGGLAEGAVKSGLEAAGYEGKTLASRALAKAAGMGAAGATEGAVFGAGSTISESQLKGEPLTSEALVASMGRNALFGGAIGAGAGLLGELAPTLIKKALPTPEKLEEQANGFVRKQLGRDFENVGKGQSREVAEDWKNASAKQFRERKLIGGENAGKTVLEASRNPVDIADNLAQMKADIGGEIGATHEKVAALIDQAPELGPSAEELIARLEKKADEFRGQHNSGAYSQARAIQGEIKALKNAIALPEVAMAPIGEGAEALGGSVVANDVAPGFGYRQIRGWQQDLEGQLNPAGTPKAMRGAVVKNLAARQAVSDIANDYIKETAGKALAAAGEDGATLSRLNQEYAGASSMENSARKEADRVLKNRRVSLTDHMLGIGSALTAMASGNVGALGVLGFGAASAIGNKIMREQGNAVMAQILHRASRMDSLVETAAKALSATPDRLVAPIDLASHRDASNYVPLGGRKLAEDFSQTRERVRQLASPDAQQAQLAHATADFGHAYPDAATGASQQLLKLFQHLNESLPQLRGGSPLSPLARPATVTPREMHRFLTRVNAALDPSSVIADVAEGKFDKDAVDTLEAVYPQTYAKLRDKAIETMTSSKDQMPFTKTILVSRLFKIDGDSSLGPRLATIQASIRQADAAENAPPTSPSRSALKLGKSYSLPGQNAPGEG